MLCRKYEGYQKIEGNIVSNYKTRSTLKTEYEGYLDAAPLQLERIAVVQR